MVKQIIIVSSIVSLLLMGMAYSVPAIAQERGTKVLVQVDGLSCPFCAFGLEKKLKKLSGVEAVTIKVDQGVAEVIFAPGSVIHQNKIREAVEAGGFTPREIRVIKPETESPLP
jgi:mercuric ion binding protein